jgi:hypothetical protein
MVYSMSMNDNTQESLIKCVTPTTINALSEIDRLHVCKSCLDAAGAVQAGAVLLAISSEDNDKDGDGFRYLIGLRHGASLTPYLTNYF